MSAREAAVRLSLENGQFLVAMKATGDEVEKVGKRGKKSMDLIGVGSTAAKRSMAELGGAVKNMAKLALSLGGAFSMGSAVQEAVKLQSTYARLSYAIRENTGTMTSANEVQRLVEQSAAKSAHTNAEMAATFGEIFQSSGDLDFSRKVLDSVGTASLATGEDLGTLASLADDLHDKFNVSAEGMLDSFAQIYASSSKGGPKFAEFAEAAGTVGAELLAAGLDGKRGLDFMIGSLINTNGPMKNLPAQMKGIKAMLRGLGNESDLKALSKSLGIDPKIFFNDKDAYARLHRVLGMGQKGIDALNGSMKEGEEKQVMKVLFTDPFEKALAAAHGSGLKGQAAIDAALVAFDGQVKNFGRSMATGAAMQREANARAQSPAAQLTAALNTLTTAFSRPEIIKAINQLSKTLPTLAKYIGDFVDFAVKHPMTTAIGVVGGKAAGAGGAAIGGAVLKSLLSGGAGAAAGAGAAGAGAGAAGAATGSAGVFGVGAGSVGVAAVALPAAIFAAIAAGGLIMKEQIGAAYDSEADVMKELSEASLSGMGGGSLDDQKAKLERLKAAHTTAAQADVGGGAMDYIARIIPGGPDSRAQADDAMKLSEEVIDKLEAAIARREAALAAPPVAAAGAPGSPSKPTSVKLEDNAGRMIGEATATALGGKILTVRLANAGDVGMGRSNAGPGGSRGPMAARPTTPGGGT
jgi:hypothetical protein